MANLNITKRITCDCTETWTLRCYDCTETWTLGGKYLLSIARERVINEVENSRQLIISISGVETRALLIGGIQEQSRISGQTNYVNVNGIVVNKSFFL